MQTILSQFDADAFIKLEKDYSYQDGFGSGYNSGKQDGLIDLYLKGILTQANVLEALEISPAQFDAAVTDYQSKAKTPS